MDNVIYICAQPANLYYAWQVEVMLNNFIKIGIDLSKVHIVSSIQSNIESRWIELSKSYNANFFFYPDTRKRKKYISSIRPNILKQHFIQNAFLKKNTIFYHDCDIIFTKNPNKWLTQEMIIDDVWYGSDTISYIGYKYIKSKGDDILSAMVNVLDISPEIVKNNELNSIGAQYLLKDIDNYFWEKVENDSESLYNIISELNNIKTASIETEVITYNPLQIWCADMWALLWNGWKLGKKTICHKNFNFTWSTDHIDMTKKYNIYHNAGVTEELRNSNNLFFKSDYMNKLPYNENLDINKNRASYLYWKEIQETAKKSVLYKFSNETNNDFKPRTGTILPKWDVV